MKPNLCLIFCMVASACLSTQVIAADAACAPLMKAVEKGMAQPRIHAASIVSREGEKKKDRNVTNGVRHSWHSVKPLMPVEQVG